ncbi:DUF1801 domain-containing protein [Rhodobacter sp. SGA-6-6]|uniref:DUF1801 domain-containing protein n=1 Tax=Rhodobacter sp. SGA-6-6 TaxID=2710882 RepID=UPI0013EB8366|nr:DUF1801 domain-containing protein [Rhodobacter sp. SGA-6-6]NGM44868.1 DUF1801 domain-containing protein [Rhodobacter sp. SGA-6-6]
MAQKTQSAPFDRAAWEAGLEPALRAEAAALLALFSRATGWEPRLWGGSMVGFGRYAYRYASGHAGEPLATGFAARKMEWSVYILPGYADHGAILARLGPHRVGKSCLYLRRLDRVDMAALEDLVRAGLADLARHWPVYPV